MRLTKKENMARYGYKYLRGMDNFGEGCNKLGQLEDIEENKGCDLLVLEKVSQTWKIYSVWKKDYLTVVRIVLWEQYTRPYLECWYFDENMKQHTKLIFIDEYLSTWALTREGFENEG